MNVEPISFLTLNQEALELLVTFVDFAAERLTIGFVEVNFAQDRDILINALKQHPRCQDVQFEVLHFPDPNLRFLRDAILEKLPQIHRASDKKLVLIITGLEQAIGMLGDYPPMLQDLNYIRDAFATSVPHPLLFCLPDYALTRLAKFAPDFWAWRSGVFKFKTTAAAQTHALSQTLESDRIRESLDLPEKQERIDLLLRLLMDYAPSGHTETLANLKNRIEILNELGIAYRSRGEVQKAEDVFQQGLKLADDSDELAQVKASVLHALGILKADQGAVEEAIALYQQSLEIEERIGNVQGKAATLHQMAILKANQGAVEEAIALYQQSLEIEERIGNVQGKAATLHNMADLKANQGAVEEAIALYQQSLEIKERIGNVQGKAATLAMLGQLLADERGDFVKALTYLKEALEILQSIKSPDAETVRDIIARVQRMAE